jgi:predicted glycosyltransferase involved in capsule biosynthesis
MALYSVIIPWSDRPELAITALRNNAIFERHDVEIIVINAGGRSDMLVALMTLARVPTVRCVELPGATFNRSLCLNIGAFASRGKYLFFLDCDIFVTVDFLKEADEYLGRGRCYLTMRRIYESIPEPPGKADGTDWTFISEIVKTTEFTTVDGRRAILRSRNTAETRPGHGLILLSKRDMFLVGGQNALFTGWGFEDTDLQTRLQLKLGLECIECGEVTHITHDSSARDFRAWLLNKSTAYANYKNGNYSGTLESDIATWADKLVELPATW